MNDLDFSVVVPTFRRPRILLETLHSILSQTGVTLDVTVLDDSPEGSARASVEGLADPSVRYVHRSQPSGGRPALVRNEGFRDHARGTWVHFLDDDDLVTPGTYAVLKETFQARPDVRMIFGKVAPFGEDPQAVSQEERFFHRAALRARWGKFPLAGRWWLIANQFFADTMLVNSACVLHRTAVERIGGYDTSLPLVEDVEFYARVIREFPVLFLDRVVLRYRISASSLMHSRRDEQQVERSYEIMHRKYREQHGSAEFFAMKLLATTVGRLVP